MWTSQKSYSKGRRFFGCPFYKVKEKYCGYFKWYDDEQLTNNEELTYKIAVLEARIGEL